MDNRVAKMDFASSRVRGQEAGEERKQSGFCFDGKKCDEMKSLFFN